MAKIQKNPVILHVCCKRSPVKLQSPSPVFLRQKPDVPSPRWVRFFTQRSKARSRRQRLPESCHKKKGPPAILPVPVVGYGTELKNLMIWFAHLNTMHDCKWSSNASAGYFYSVLHQAVQLHSITWIHKCVCTKFGQQVNWKWCTWAFSSDLCQRYPKRMSWFLLFLLFSGYPSNVIQVFSACEEIWFHTGETSYHM